MRSIKRILLFKMIIFLISTIAVAQNKKFGVFIGVGKYPQASETLPSSANDAAGMRDAFLSSGGTSSILLTDEKATRREIIKSILDFQKLAKEEDLFVFYYSGHGTLFPDRFSELLDENISATIKFRNGAPILNGKNEKSDAALVPYDSASDSDNKPWKNLILDDELYQLFAGFAQKRVRIVFISDSCYSGGQAKNLFSEDNQIEDDSILGKPKFVDWKAAVGIKNETEIKTKPISQKNFTFDPNLNNRYIMVASSQSNQLSFSKNPETGSRMSLFTYYFLEVFNEYKKANKKFTFQTILDRVSPEVRNFAMSGNRVQIPQVDQTFYKLSLDVTVF